MYFIRTTLIHSTGIFYETGQISIVYRSLILGKKKKKRRKKRKKKRKNLQTKILPVPLLNQMKVLRWEVLLGTENNVELTPRKDNENSTFGNLKLLWRNWDYIEMLSIVFSFSSYICVFHNKEVKIDKYPWCLTHGEYFS